MNWKFWKKEKVTKVFHSDKESLPVDLTQIRNLHERLGSMELGKAFGVATREGIKIFKLVEIKPYSKKKVL